MQHEDYFFFGRIAKTVGLKGEVMLIMDVDEPARYENLESIFLEIKGNLIPFFIEHSEIRSDSNHLIIQFEGFNDVEKAKVICGSNAFLPIELLPPLKGNKFYFHEVTGFEVIDKTYGSIGVVDHIVDLPSNPLFSIWKDEKEILLPVQDSFILSLNRETRQIFVDAPDGLISLYI